MPLNTYGELKSAIADFMNRSDMTTLQVETFVSLAETDIRNDVRVREMETTTAVTVTGSTFAAPALMLEARELQVEGWNYEFVPKDVFSAVQRNGASSHVFTQVGTNFLINRSGTAAVALTYLSAPESLSGSTATNYILTYAPDVYLYGACSHAASYYGDDAALQKYKALYMGAKDRLNARESRAKVSGSMLQIYPATRE